MKVFNLFTLFTVLTTSDAFSQLVFNRSYNDLSTTAISAIGTRPLISKKPTEKGAPVSTAKSTIKASATKFSLPSFGGKKVVSNKSVVLSKNSSTKGGNPVKTSGNKISLSSFGGKKGPSNDKKPSTTKVKVTKMSNKTSSVPVFYLPKLSTSQCVEVIRIPRKNGSFEVKMVSKD